jgi:hypothetical protein
VLKCACACLAGDKSVAKSTNTLRPQLSLAQVPPENRQES